jgi:hypothetical protein
MAKISPAKKLQEEEERRLKESLFLNFFRLTKFVAMSKKNEV